MTRRSTETVQAGIATQFSFKDGTLRMKTRFVLGFSAVANIGGRQFAIVAPTIEGLETAWLDAVKYPLEKSKVQKVGLVAQERIR